MQTVIYVSPAGNDRNPGTADAPFATLQQARQAVRERIASFTPGAEQDIEVHLAAGTHRLTETLVLDQRDSGSDSFKVTWKGAADGKTVISSGHPLAGWQKLEDEPDWLAPAAKGRVWFIDLPAGSSITTLYCQIAAHPLKKFKKNAPLAYDEARHGYVLTDPPSPSATAGHARPRPQFERPMSKKRSQIQPPYGGTPRTLS